jgi:L-asparaginase II
VLSQPLVEVVRSGFREGVHHGSVVLLNPAGEAVRAIGEVHRPMLPRSASKPIQALAMLRAGLNLPDDADLAVVCASHNGEPEHVERVLGILAGAGLTEDDLGCPPALPMHEPAALAVLATGGQPRRVYMNCSGKHAGMVATSAARGWPVAGYLEPAHPLQVAVAAALTEVASEPVAATVVDGCGAPLHGISLAGLALAFARLVRAAPGTGERRVVDAMRAHPHLVAGTGREDTRLMAAVPGLVSKSGAEGVHAVALPDGRAVALKIEDGAARARLPVMVAALRLLGVDSPGLDALAEEPVLGGGRVVGCARILPGALTS